MLYRVTKRADDLAGLFATLFTGAGSISVIVGDTWGHFHRTGKCSGVFVTEPAEPVFSNPQYDVLPIRPATRRDMQFILDLRGTPWRVWRNCFGVLGGLWRN